MYTTNNIVQQKPAECTLEHFAHTHEIPFPNLASPNSSSPPSLLSSLATAKSFASAILHLEVFALIHLDN